MENKITKREMYEAIITLAQTGVCPQSVTDVVAFCENEVALLDRKALKAKERAAEKRAAGDELTEAVKAALTDELETRDVIAARVAETFGEDASIAKVGYRLVQLAKAGDAVSEDIKIPATETSKARTVKGYRIG